MAHQLTRRMQKKTDDPVSPNDNRETEIRILATATATAAVQPIWPWSWSHVVMQPAVARVGSNPMLCWCSTRSGKHTSMLFQPKRDVLLQRKLKSARTSRRMQRAPYTTDCYPALAGSGSKMAKNPWHSGSNSAMRLDKND